MSQRNPDFQFSPLFTTCPVPNGPILIGTHAAGTSVRRGQSPSIPKDLRSVLLRGIHSRASPLLQILKAAGLGKLEVTFLVLRGHSGSLELMITKDFKRLLSSLPFSYTVPNFIHKLACVHAPTSCYSIILHYTFTQK